MTINLKQLIEDREAGTPGNWTDDCREHDEPYQPIKIKGGRHTVCSVWMDDAPVHDFNAMQRANARRIARLPDLEEAFLEAVEILKIYSDISSGPIIRDFLEKLK